MSDTTNETDGAAAIASMSDAEQGAWDRTLERNETQEKLAGVATNFTRCMLRTKDTATFAREVGDPELAAKIERAVSAMLAVTGHIHDRLETCARAAHLVGAADRVVARASSAEVAEHYAHLAPQRPNGGA